MSKEERLPVCEVPDCGDLGTISWEAGGKRWLCDAHSALYKRKAKEHDRSTMEKPYFEWFLSYAKPTNTIAVLNFLERALNGKSPEEIGTLPELSAPEFEYAGFLAERKFVRSSFLGRGEEGPLMPTMNPTRFFILGHNERGERVRIHVRPEWLSELADILDGANPNVPDPKQ